MVALGNLHTGSGHRLRTLAHLANHARKPLLHVDQGLVQACGFIAALHLHHGREVTGRHRVRQPYRILDRAGNAAHKSQSQHRSTQHPKPQQNHHAVGQTLSLALALLQGLVEQADGSVIETVNRVDGAAEVVEIRIGSERQGLRVDQALAGHGQCLADLLVQYPGRAFQVLAKSGVVRVGLGQVALQVSLRQKNLP